MNFCKCIIKQAISSVLRTSGHQSATVSQNSATSSCALTKPSAWAHPFFQDGCTLPTEPRAASPVPPCSRISRTKRSLRRQGRLAPRRRLDSPTLAASNSASDDDDDEVASHRRMRSTICAATLFFSTSAS